MHKNRLEGSKIVSVNCKGNQVGIKQATAICDFTWFKRSFQLCAHRFDPRAMKVLLAVMP